MSKVVLGIDPGTRLAGWGVVVDEAGKLSLVAAGVVRAKGDLPASERLRLVFEGMSAVLREHAVELVAVEEAFFGKNVHSALRLGEGRAVAILAAALAGRAVVELAPSLVKKAVTGHGGATKEQVRASVEMILGANGADLAKLPLDATDALALAIAAHARTGSVVGAGSAKKKARGRRGWTLADVERLSGTGD